MTSKYNLPFDLPAPSTYHIPLQPHTIALMRDGEEIEVRAIEAIVEAWQKDETKPFGISINRKYGFSGPENKRLASTNEEEAEFARRSMEITERVITETGKPLDEVRAAAVSMDATGIVDEWIKPYAIDILACSKMPVREYHTKRLTVLVQRAIPNWTYELTEALDDSIQDELSKFLQLELEGIIDEKKLLPLNN